MDLLPYFTKGVPYSSYLEAFELEASSESDHKYHHYVQLNWGRTKRLEKQVNIQDRFKDSDLSSVKGLIITETWCGDSAQNLSWIAEICRLCGIDIRVVYRDQNTELIDAFLTEGGRSIPKIIFFEPNNGDVLATWGPRPAPLQEIVMANKASGAIDYQKLMITAQKWYNEDKGSTLQNELYELLANV